MDTTVRSMFSHVQRLPNELLAEIFLYYHEAVVHSYPHPNLPPPLLLTQICSTWRHVAHGMPKLWTTFSLDANSQVTTRKADHVSFAKAWLSRAQPHPLCVSLSINTTDQAFNRIVDAILPSADRLQDLRLYLPISHFWPLLNLAVGSMALLESVELSVMPSVYNQEATYWTKKITAFARAPRLRSVALFSCDVDALYCNIQMPWSQLTKLFISESYQILNTSYRDVFLQCTNLVDCTLYVNAWEEWDVPDVPIVVLPHLRRLVVTFIDHGRSSPFFQPLNLPALKDLTVATTDGCAWSQPIFMELTLRSSLDLEQLYFDHLEINPDALLQLLPHMKSLIKLHINLSKCIDDNLFDALCYRGMDGQHLAPKLEILDVYGFTGYDIDHNGIANMIESRWWTDDAPRMVSRLKTVAVGFYDREIDAGVRERLEHCSREGLSLTLPLSKKLREEPPST